MERRVSGAGMPQPQEEEATCSIGLKDIACPLFFSSSSRRCTRHHHYDNAAPAAIVRKEEYSWWSADDLIYILRSTTNMEKGKKERVI